MRRNIFARNPRAVAGFLERMSEARALLAQFPAAGFERAAPPVPGVRRRVAGDYLIDYAVIRDDIVVLSIRHGAQSEPPSADPDFDFEA